MDEQKNSQLDEEYKSGLQIIKQCILNCCNSDYVSSCGLWLQRLEACGPEERTVRNQYLNELCRQMQNGQLEESFLSPPPPLFQQVSVSVDGDGSWSDMSTVSTTTLEIVASGDNYELGEVNHATGEPTLDLSSLATDVEYLKGRLKDLIKLKKKLQRSHEAAVVQWESRTHSLEDRLNEACQENTRLQSVIVSLEEKLQNQQNEERQEHNLKEAHKKEIDELRNRNFQLLKHMDDKHVSVLKQKEAEFDAKLKEMELCYETKIATLNSANEDSMKSLISEKERLETLLEEERKRNDQEIVYIKKEVELDQISTNDLVEEKVVHLQVCIAKMEKLLRKYEKHYTKKINSLKKDLRSKDNMLQMQLAAQRAELLVLTSSEKNSDIENVVSQLECRYRELLDEQYARMVQNEREQAEIIQKLVSKLESL